MHSLLTSHASLSFPFVEVFPALSSSIPASLSLSLSRSNHTCVIPTHSHCCYSLFQERLDGRQADAVDVFGVARHRQSLLPESERVLAGRYARVFLQGSLPHKRAGRVHLEVQNAHVLGVSMFAVGPHGVADGGRVIIVRMAAADRSTTTTSRLVGFLKMHSRTVRFFYFVCRFFRSRAWTFTRSWSMRNAMQLCVVVLPDKAQSVVTGRSCARCVRARWAHAWAPIWTGQRKSV